MSHQQSAAQGSRRGRSFIGLGRNSGKLELLIEAKGLDKKKWKQLDISDMALFAGVQHLRTFNIVAPLIYDLLPYV